MHVFCVEISSHGRECRSSDRSKLALVQLITLKFERYIKLVTRYKDDVFARIEVDDYLRLVAQSRCSIGLQVNTRKATLTPK